MYNSMTAQNKLSKQRDYGISLLRVVSMAMIVLCHIASYLNINAIAQMLNVGVYTFLLISGWLYSGKQIDNYRKWVVTRWIRLCIPVLIWFAVAVLIGKVCFNTNPRWMDTILFVTNLQGASWIISFFPAIDTAFGLGNLWFVTVIFVCYMLLPVSLRMQRAPKSRRYVYWSVILVLYFFLAFVGVNLIYFICFFIGVELGRDKMNCSTKWYIVLTAAMIIAVGGRLVARYFLDNTVFYDVIVIGSSHTVLAVWIFYTVKIIEQKSVLVSQMARSKLVVKMDHASYYVYIVHNFFLGSMFGLKYMVGSIVYQIATFVILVTISTLVLQFASERAVVHLKKVMNE